MDHPPPVLRTGLVGDGPTAKIDKHSPMGKRLVGLVFVLVKRAATSAALFCRHAGRYMVTPDDVRKALRYHAVSFFSESGFEQLERDVESMEAMVDQFVSESIGSGDVVDTFADEAIDTRSTRSQDGEEYDDDESEDDEDDDDDESEDDDESDMDGPPPFPSTSETLPKSSDNPCTCDVCRGIRELDWDAWQPTDPAECFIKSHIDFIDDIDDIDSIDHVDEIDGTND